MRIWSNISLHNIIQIIFLNVWRIKPIHMLPTSDLTVLSVLTECGTASSTLIEGTSVLPTHLPPLQNFQEKRSDFMSAFQDVIIMVKDMYTRSFKPTNDHNERVRILLIRQFCICFVFAFFVQARPDFVFPLRGAIGLFCLFFCSDAHQVPLFLPRIWTKDGFDQIRAERHKSI